MYDTVPYCVKKLKVHLMQYDFRHVGDIMLLLKVLNQLRRKEFVHAHDSLETC